MTLRGRSRARCARGSSLVELIVAMCVLGAILALGMPSYHGYGEEGRAAQCATNRHAIEAAERACALKHDGQPCLTPSMLAESGYLGTIPGCASGGTYVWIVGDPAQPGYPKIGCSKHFFPHESPRS
jgi:type II secretory pathway pseudopilin PulG